MSRITFRRVFTAVCAVLATSVPAFAQIELTGSYSSRMHEDYIERGPGSELGNFTGMPMNDEARAKALMYTSDVPSMNERQCLPQGPWVELYRPQGVTLSKELDENGRVLAWRIGGDYLRATTVIWMDGRPHPGPNALHDPSGFTTGKWEGDTLTTLTTHVKIAWIRRGVGIPGSDESTFIGHITRHDNLLTITVIQEDPNYLTEPHVVSRVFEFDPRGNTGGGGGADVVCNTANEVPRFEDSGIVPHYLPGQNPEADYMIRNYNLPKEAAMGYAETLYPEYRKKIRNTYVPPASCGRYCCGWIERQGLPGAAPGLTCKDGDLAEPVPGQTPALAPVPAPAKKP